MSGVLLSLVKTKITFPTLNFFADIIGSGASLEKEKIILIYWGKNVFIP